MNVLIFCEESQVECKAFLAHGHNAYSIDIKPCSGGRPDRHIICDAVEVMERLVFGLDHGTRQYFRTENGKLVYIPFPDLIIAHPPCTYLTTAGACRLFTKNHSIKDVERLEKMYAASYFFSLFLNFPCEKICVENPLPMIAAGLPDYSQIIHPYMFGHNEMKRTCLWLKGLPNLIPTKIIEKEKRIPFNKADFAPKKGGETRRTNRSKSFEGVAKAMAEQWGGGDIIDYDLEGNL